MEKYFGVAKIHQQSLSSFVACKKVTEFRNCNVRVDKLVPRAHIRSPRPFSYVFCLRGAVSLAVRCHLIVRGTAAAKYRDGRAISQKCYHVHTAVCRKTPRAHLDTVDPLQNQSIQGKRRERRKGKRRRRR